MLIKSFLFVTLAQVAIARTLLFSSSSSTSPAGASLPACAVFHGEYEGTPVYAYEATQCRDLKQLQAWLESLEIDRTYDAEIAASLDQRAATVLLHIQRARTVETGTPGTAHSWLATVEDHLSTVTSRMQEDHPGQDSSNHQRIFARPGDAATKAGLRPRLVHYDKSETSAFYSVPRSLLPIVDTLFPASAVLVTVPTGPLPSPRNASDVPQWLSDSLRNVHYSPLVDAILQDVDPDVIEKDVRHLTGEDGQSVWTTRHSFTEGGQKAGEWIKHSVEQEASGNCQYFHHEEGFNPNVICSFEGTEHPDELVILGAHYDSRGTFGYVRAPGGDDDASGVSALLSLARLFKSFNVQLKRTVVLAFFSGEEQGLLGSKAYARSLKDGDKKVRFMLQADMLGYHASGEPMQLALPDRFDTIQARWLVGNLSMTYVPELQVGTTPACCSDHQSFDEQGFVSTWVFERNGPIADPKYHNSEDLSDRPGYDFKQISSIAKVMLATVLNVAEFTL
ncbi:Zn-dependent exopeptidase [Cystobasidium minutum MCA 4210]|uniref:Zn-dependent exopeptidase n=1 Tax=Cystobasidium minutum MCA 4210 TaxID=1397322 RepID=UPI0034CFBBA5|eukprot:jgi/Rhomi1/89961/CE89960_1238